MRCAMSAGVAVLCGGSSLLAQASFTPYFCAGGGVAALSGDGMRILVQIPGGGPGLPTTSCRLFFREGGTMDYYFGGGRAFLSALNYAGTMAWGTTDALGGNVRKCSGSTAATSTAYFAGYASDVSDDEHAVVGRTGIRAFVWDPSSGPTPLQLQPLSGTTASEAYGVSPHGQFVAGISFNPPLLPVRWAAMGGWAPMALALPVGFTSAKAQAVSDTGLAVGIASGLAPNTSRNYPVVWDGAGNVRILPIVGNRGEAWDISADGSVIVGFESGNGPIAPVVWRNGVREDVVALLAGAGVSTAGFTFDNATEISTDGTVIAARGVGADIGTVACFITLPPACAPDVGGAGGLPGRDGQLDNNDFIAFINHFFAHDARADLGVVGGERGADGVFDNNDFIQFITLFFNGCN